ncbi:MAG: helix-turn-helix domain-containing protein [Firmicutes bacterium]|jgi:transcriptional regulator with XRE-family HTH domain|nr:helix-turn-helix domain-containing protein [Bacillota bacterium]
MKTFSEKVKDARDLLGLNQQELADLVGVSKRTIATYETVDVKPRQSTMRKLASALQVSIDYLKRDEIDDPTYGLEKEPYVDEVRERLGAKAAREIDFLMEKNNALFAGGEIPQETKDAYFEAVMAAYLECKEQAKKKFGRKKN